jgi:hypothetical protein
MVRLPSKIMELYLQSHRYDENTRKNCGTSILEHNHSDICTGENFMTVLNSAWSRKWSLQNRPRWCRSSRSSQHKSIWRLVHILTFNVDQFLALQDVDVLLTLQEWCEAGVIFVCASVFSSQCCLTYEFAMGMIMHDRWRWCLILLMRPLMMMRQRKLKS